MKTPEKDKFELLPEKPSNGEQRANQVFIKPIPVERFEHWGYLMYSEIISELISIALISKVAKN